MSERTCGVLLPLFSLPGKYGIGGLSKEAYAYIDYLKKAGQTYWQILPVGPTSFGDSPYQSFSTFAGNPYFISLQEWIRQGLLTKQECKEVDFGEDESLIDYEKQYKNRYPLLQKAFARSSIKKDSRFRKFCKKNRKWLKDYCLFMAIKDSYDGKSFLEWEEGLRFHQKKALKQFQKAHHEDILFHAFLQFTFFREWFRFKKYANKKGIRIIGDIPIYVSADSADAWANPRLFQFDDERKPTRVAGCPPDGFSAEGQLWGNPLYDWDYHRATGYEWWVDRMKSCLRMYDVVRIDHFRGFDAYYSIPYGAENAIDGEWIEGPGAELFSVLESKLGEMDIIAEDLGLQTDSVREMVAQTGYPNMKVLQFAFGSASKKGRTPSEYLPFTYDTNCVVYTGTHDSETMLGYLSHCSKAELKRIRRYLGLERDATLEAMVRGLIRIAFSSAADYCMIPLQDYLALGNEARTNEPATLGANWRWRATKEQLFSARLQKEMKRLARAYWRG